MEDKLMTIIFFVGLALGIVIGRFLSLLIDRNVGVVNGKFRR